MSELAEGARLEIVCAVKSGTEGSNPSLSAILIKGSGFKGSTFRGQQPETSSQRPELSNP
jgi:hypothetical protein